MKNSQHLCVVSDDIGFHDQVSRHFVSLGVTIQWFRTFDGFLGALVPFGACLVLDADLARQSGPGHHTGGWARGVMDLLANRPAQGVVVVHTPDPTAQAGQNRLYDGMVQRADQLLAKPLGRDQLAFALQTLARKPAAASSSRPGDRSGDAAWQFDPVAMALIPPAGESFALSASEARLIALLITKDPEPVRRQDLIELFGIKSPNIRRIDTTVYRLRHKIEQYTGYESPFSTVHGVGYRNKGLSATVPLQI